MRCIGTDSVGSNLPCSEKRVTPIYFHYKSGRDIAFIDATSFPTSLQILSSSRRMSLTGPFLTGPSFSASSHQIVLMRSSQIYSSHFSSYLKTGSWCFGLIHGVLFPSPHCILPEHRYLPFVMIETIPST